MRRVHLGLQGALLLALPLITIGFVFQDQRSEPVFRVTSSRVIAEFIAVDKKGHVVRDLSLAELEVEADGRKQKIDFLQTPEQTAPSLVWTPSQLQSSQESGPGAGAASEPRREPLHTAILLDTRAMDANNFGRSVAAIRLFIEQSLEANSVVMLAEIDRGLKIRLPLTGDREKLAEVVSSLTPASVYNPLAPDRLGEDPEAYLQEMEKQVIDLREGLSQLCHTLAGLPGSKHIVFFSEGYPLDPAREADRGTRTEGFRGVQRASHPTLRDPGVLSMVQEVVSFANTFGVTFYPIDARGLVAVAGMGSADQSADVATGPGDGTSRLVVRELMDTGAAEVQLGAFQQTRLSNLDSGHNTLLALAGGTNGTAFFNTNDLGTVLRASISEQNYRYRLSFVPDLKGKPRFRRLEVKTSRPDIIIRSQAGFTDFGADQLLNTQLSLAFSNPGLFQNLDPVLETEIESRKLRAVIGVHGSGVSGFQQQDKFRIEVLFVGRLYDEKGKPASKTFDIQRGFQLELDREQFLSLNGQPLLANQELELKPGKYRLVLVVLDRISGRVGTVERELMIS